MVVPRPPSPSEWAELVSDYPGLTRNNVIITGERDPIYNCIAYSLGITNAWIDPPQPLAAFQALYNGAPYNHPTMQTADAAAVIDGWALPPNPPSITELTHGSRIYPTTPGLWESKLGGTERITHGRGEVSGNLYGRIVTSFG